MSPKREYDYLQGKDSGLAIDRESGVIYAIKHFAGMPQLFKSLKTKDKREARRLLPQRIKEHLEQYADGKSTSSDPTVAEVIEEIERAESPKLRAKTQSKRRFYFARIRDEMELGHLPVSRLTLKVWADRLARVQAKRKRRTYWDYVKHANIILRFAYRQKYVSHWLTFPNTDGPHKEGTVFTLDEIRALWEVMGVTTRDQFVLSYECCMRLREVLHLTWDRVDLESGEITLRAQDVKTGSKTKRGRTFIMTPHALERMRARKDWIGHSDFAGTKWVFPSPTGTGPIDDNKTAWNRAKRDVLEGSKLHGTKPMPHFQHWGTWHDLRHSAISRMLCEQKMNITHVSEYVGTSVSTLQRVYLHSRAEHTKGVNAGLMILGEK